jgi:hypothetical protein
LKPVKSLPINKDNPGRIVGESSTMKRTAFDPAKHAIWRIVWRDGLRGFGLLQR